jgi:hypothetical protein
LRKLNREGANNNAIEQWQLLAHSNGARLNFGCCLRLATGNDWEKYSTSATMPNIKSRTESTEDVKQARLAAARSFKRGDRVRHKLTHKLGVFQELNLGFALPEVWVQFDSVREIAVTLSCNPLELERVDSSTQEPEIQSGSELANVENQLVANVKVLEELSETEAAERHRLELRVERAFFEAGRALRELKQKKLYRSTHKTFEDYCAERFGFSRRHPYRLIDAASVFENLCPNGTQNDLLTNNGQILPTSERQVRALVSLEPQQQREIWHSAVLIAGGRVPSSRIVKGIVEQLKEKPLRYATDFCYVGDAFTLTRLEGCERKYNNYPCIATKLKDFTILVEVFDGTIAVKPENLRPIDDPDVCRQLPATIRRIRQLRSVGLLDRGADALLTHLGRQMYLTNLEVELLTFLEQRYEVSDAISEE